MNWLDSMSMNRSDKVLNMLSMDNNLTIDNNRNKLMNMSVSLEEDEEEEEDKMIDYNS